MPCLCPTFANHPAQPPLLPLRPGACQASCSCKRFRCHDYIRSYRAPRTTIRGIEHAPSIIQYYKKGQAWRPQYILRHQQDTSTVQEGAVLSGMCMGRMYASMGGMYASMGRMYALMGRMCMDVLRRWRWSMRASNINSRLMINFDSLQIPIMVYVGSHFLHLNASVDAWWVAPNWAISCESFRVDSCDCSTSQVQ